MEKITIFTVDEIQRLLEGEIVEATDGYDGTPLLFMNTERYAKYVNTNENGEANSLADITSEKREWTPCYYENGKLHHEGGWKPGRWYEWIDRNYNIEIARMKDDAEDHFFPDTKIIKEDDVIAFRETSYNVAVRVLLNQMISLDVTTKYCPPKDESELKYQDIFNDCMLHYPRLLGRVMKWSPVLENYRAIFIWTDAGKFYYSYGTKRLQPAGD